ncbi:sulfatase [Echinicola strongylocentroti]|uniref:Sulfatase n=1 Tax=Echinicola strongylocentroti TaxID=1795355 RepID=A0A2Z4IPT8_9BACT|nr:sulfatase [Echinicola strongylocentroti]AWW32658.1 sulfatase [Echinicola strongylocentroti]
MNPKIDIVGKSTTWALVATCIIASMFSCTTQKEEGEATASKRPNIIFIMSDDHAYQAISAYSDKLINTPNIDRIANEGMLFEKAFVSNSICAPSRAVILTGKHSHLNGLVDNAVKFDSTQVTFPKILRENGYQTAMIGKWHLKTQPTGFDYWKVLPGQGHYYNPEFRTKEGVVLDSGYVTDLITDFAIDWLDKAKGSDEPFMLMYQHKAPHREWLPTEENFREYANKEFPEPESLFDDYSGRGSAAKEAEMRIDTHMGVTSDNKIHPDIAKKMGYENFLTWYPHAYHNNLDRMSPSERAAWEEVYGPMNEAFEKANLRGDELTKWKYQRYMQDYLASIESVDENVGRLLDYLEENGLAENTIVVYTSDQGFYLGEHGWFDKRFMYEESFRTPLMIKWPGVIKEGSRNTDLVQNLDFAETFLDAAGVTIPKEMQGKSMLPLLKGEKVEWREALYYHYYEYPGIHAVKRHNGVRTDRYKLIHFYYDVDEWELYDLEKDPQEMNNVYADPAYADVKEKMHQKLDELVVQYKDEVVVPTE